MLSTNNDRFFLDDVNLSLGQRRAMFQLAKARTSSLKTPVETTICTNQDNSKPVLLVMAYLSLSLRVLFLW